MHIAGSVMRMGQVNWVSHYEEIVVVEGQMQDIFISRVSSNMPSKRASNVMAAMR